jgi:hypothetical protein
LVAASQTSGISIGIINGRNHNDICRGSNLCNPLRASAFAGSNLPDPHASIYSGSNLPDPFGSPHGGSRRPGGAPPGKPHHIF